MSATNIITVKDNPMNIWGNDPNSWLIFAAITIGVFLIEELIRKLITARLERIHEKTANQFDDALLSTIKNTYKIPIILFSIFIGAKYIEVPKEIDLIFTKCLSVAFILQFGIWISSFVGTIISFQYSRKGSSRRSALNLISFISRLIVWTLTFLVVLDNLGVDITTFVAGLGIGGIAVAMALQNILGDLFSSLSIILDKPFEEGDYIIVDSMQGNVEKIGIKTTRVRSLSGEEIIFSNSDLLSARIKNYKTLYERRVPLAVGVTYETPSDKLHKIPDMIKEIISNIDNVRFDRAHFQSFGDSSLNFEIIYYVQDPAYQIFMDKQQQINLAIFNKFEDEKIDFAYPTQKLLIENTTL